jgi:SNF2-related domain
MHDVCLSVWLQERRSLQADASGRDVVVMSYEALRSDADWVAEREWGYCVLDEGHVIRNPKSLVGGQLLAASAGSISLGSWQGLAIYVEFGEFFGEFYFCRMFIFNFSHRFIL